MNLYTAYGILVIVLVVYSMYAFNLVSIIDSLLATDSQMQAKSADRVERDGRKLGKRGWRARVPARTRALLCWSDGRGRVVCAVIASRTTQPEVGESGAGGPGLRTPGGDNCTT